MFLFKLLKKYGIINIIIISIYQIYFFFLRGNGFFVDFSVEKKNNKFHAVIPTPYYILALIKKQKYLSKENVSAFIDFGSGEGLVVSYMRDYLGYKSIYAYELNKFLIERFKKNYEKVKIFNKNLENFSKNDPIFFDKINKKKAIFLYFFNPFYFQLVLKIIRVFLKGKYKNIYIGLVGFNKHDLNKILSKLHYRIVLKKKKLIYIIKLKF